jgi:hypothetical protein
MSASAADIEAMPSRRGLLLLVVLVAAGCGSTPVAQERPAVANKNGSAFDVEAKRACTGLQRGLSRVQRTIPAESPRVWSELADTWETTVERLRDLDPPPEKRPRFKKMLGYFDNAIRAARLVPRAEDELVLAPIVAVMQQGGKGATIAQSLGLLSCSAVLPEPTAGERARWKEHVLRETRREFERGRRLPRLDQPAHPAGVRPRVEPTPRP